MLDTSSRAFSVLKASALVEFTAAIEFALNPEECLNCGAPQEALARWIPRTYPHDLPHLGYKEITGSDLLSRILAEPEQLRLTGRMQ